MSVLVTGGTGFVGSAVVETLLSHGERSLRCFARPDSDRSRLEALQERYPDARLEIAVGNLARRDDAGRALDGASTVYHLAAGMRGSPADLFLNTVVTSRNLLEAAARTRPARIVLVSSFAVYGVAGVPPGHVVTERTALDPHPERRDAYSHAKLRQEQLFWDSHRCEGLPLVVLRPGVVYGPRGPALSARVGLRLPRLFLHLGGNNPLPLSFIDNCAAAIVLAGLSDGTDGEAYNVHDDDLPTCAAFLDRYKREVESIRSVRIPYAMLRVLAVLNEKYHAYSRGQVPAVLTPYRTAATWKRTRFDNRKLKQLGWRPLVSTDEGLRRTFQYLRARRLEAAQYGVR